MLDDSTSAFAEFQTFCDWLYEKEQRRHGISLSRLFERVYEYLTSVRGLDERSVALEIWSDYTRSGRRDRPAFLRKFELPSPAARQVGEAGLPERQLRHL